jgi:alanine racemase
MDMTMLDITHLPDVRVLDEVVVFDGQNRLEALAKTEGTIAYEILTRISERVRRVYVSE